MTAGDGVHAGTADARALGAFARAVFALGRGAREFVVLAAALAVAEWGGLLLLLPLLATVGVRDTGGDAGGIGTRVAQFLGTFGIAPSLPGVVTVFVALVTVRALLQRRAALLGIIVEQEFVYALRDRLHDAVSRMEWVAFARQRQAEVFHTLTAETARVAHAISYLLRLTVTGAVAAAYLVVALRLSPATTLLACLGGVVLVLALRGANRRAREAGEAVSDADAALYATVESHLEGMKTARSFGVVEAMLERFRERARAMADAERTGVRNHASADAAFTIGSAVLLSAIVVLAVRVLAVPTAAMLVLLVIFARLAPQFAATLQAYQFLVGAVPSYARVMRLIVACEASVVRDDTLSPPVLPSGDIRFRDVTFRYVAGSEAPTVTNVSLDIRAVCTTALVGVTGAGKSTIADLALGLIAPERGAVEVGGHALTPSLATVWRARVGVVLQDGYLLQGSVRDNLRWVAPQADEPAMREALAQAHALGFVERLPDGLDTRVGDRGVLLSGGERQRLALARALLRKPSLLVLDEPTSAVDGETDRVIHDALARIAGETTVLIISHRLATIRHADLIHVIEEGRVIQSGTWMALLAERDGRFRAMCAAQGLLDT